MANLVYSLPVPAGDGVGAGVVVWPAGGDKSIIVAGSFTGLLSIEASFDDQFSWVQIANAAFEYSGYLFVPSLGATDMRVRGARSFSGTPAVSVQGSDTGLWYWFLDVPVTNGVGIAQDVTLLGPRRTVSVTGIDAVPGTVLLEAGSPSGYVAVAGFDFGGYKRIDCASPEMRVRLVGFQSVPAGISVSVSAEPA